MKSLVNRISFTAPSGDDDNTRMNTGESNAIHNSVLKAGDGTRTHNSQLGRLALCH